MVDMSKFNLNDLMRQAKLMQKKFQEAQDKMEGTDYEGNSGGSGYSVRIIMNGRYRVKATYFGKAIEDMLGEYSNILADLVTAAVNDAVSKISGASGSEFSDLTSGFIPPDLNLGNLGNLGFGGDAKWDLEDEDEDEDEDGSKKGNDKDEKKDEDDDKGGE